MSFGTNLTRLMAERGLDDLDVLNALKARRAGISSVTLYSHRTGRRRPSLALATSYAAVLGCTLDELTADEPVGSGAPGNGS